MVWTTRFICGLVWLEAVHAVHGFRVQQIKSVMRTDERSDEDCKPPQGLQRKQDVDHRPACREDKQQINRLEYYLYRVLVL